MGKYFFVLLSFFLFTQTFIGSVKAQCDAHEGNYSCIWDVSGRCYGTITNCCSDLSYPTPVNDACRDFDGYYSDCINTSDYLCVGTECAEYGEACRDFYGDYIYACCYPYICNDYLGSGLSLACGINPDNPPTSTPNPGDCECGYSFADGCLTPPPLDNNCTSPNVPQCIYNGGDTYTCRCGCVTPTPTVPDCGMSGEPCCEYVGVYYCTEPYECIEYEGNHICASTECDCTASIGDSSCPTDPDCGSGYITIPRCTPVPDDVYGYRCTGDCYCILETTEDPFPTEAYLQCGVYCTDSDYPFGNCLLDDPGTMCENPPDPDYAFADCHIGGVTYDCLCCTEYFDSYTVFEALDPLCDTTSIKTAIGCIPVGDKNAFLAFILRWALGISGGVSFLFIVYSGFVIMTASGDKRKTQAGKEILTAAISGIMLIIFSVFLLDFIGIRIFRIPGL